MLKSPILHGDKGYDSNAIRHKVEGKGTMPNIPPKANGTTIDNCKHGSKSKSETASPKKTSSKKKSS
jgi:hypothetical protein